MLLPDFDSKLTNASLSACSIMMILCFTYYSQVKRFSFILIIILVP